jgi:hypothetical protein
MATICPIRLPCNTRDFDFDLAKKNIGRVTTLCLGRTPAHEYRRKDNDGLRNRHKRSGPINGK